MGIEIGNSRIVTSGAAKLLFLRQRSYDGRHGPSSTGRLLLLMFNLRLKQNVLAALALLFLFLSAANAGYAGERTSSHRISYRTQLGTDLDGDHIPETATIRQCGNVYQVSIHFTTGRPKLRLSTYVTEGVAGLSFQTTDVNNDSRGDLVIFSATSLRPIGIWLNQGKATFKKTSALFYGGVGRYTGPTYRHGGTSEPQPPGNDSFDPLPQITPSAEHFSIGDCCTELLSSPPDQRPFDSMQRHTPPRGPPATARS